MWSAWPGKSRMKSSHFSERLLQRWLILNLHNYIFILLVGEMFKGYFQRLWHISLKKQESSHNSDVFILLCAGLWGVWGKKTVSPIRNRKKKSQKNVSSKSEKDCLWLGTKWRKRKIDRGEKQREKKREGYFWKS